MFHVKLPTSYPIFEFTCGHVGRTNEAPQIKASAFIRVAEVRYANPIAVDKPCPDCKRTGER